MAKIVVDGVEYEVNPDNNLLQECLSQGLDLPYFCWHPCMGSIGACRQCAVKQYQNAEDEKDAKGTLVMACMTAATDGTRISIADEQARAMRERVIESLMINHPHDCPVCEEGGECHLQDMTLMSGHNYRRYDKQKRTHRNQYLGPFINHEMNRCIACYRCVRFYDDYAGGTDLAAQAAHHHVYFGRHEEGVLESEFSGNLVEVCPTGVFTDKQFSEHYSRKWDLQTAPSVCVGCAVGCNTTPGERYGTLRRITNRYHSEINGYFLCDRGRFGFDYVNSDQRLKAAIAIRKAQDSGQAGNQPGNQAGVQPDGNPDGKPDGNPDGKRNAQEHGRQNIRISALSKPQVAELLTTIKAAGVIGIASPRAGNEANFALRRLVGEANFHAGVADDEHEANRLILQLAQDSAFHAPSIREIEQADAILIVGEDVTNTAPRIALALRQSVRNKAAELAGANRIPVWQDAAVRELAQQELSPLCIISAYATRLDDVATELCIDSYPGQVAMANAVAAKLSANAPTVSGLDPAAEAQAEKIANYLAAAQRPLIISGSSTGQVELVKAAANVARALHDRTGNNNAAIDLCLLAKECNSFGLELLTPAENNLGTALEKIQSGAVKHAIVLENDLYERAQHAQVDRALDQLETLVVLDLLPTRTTARATHLLPTTAFSEHMATLINYEGRAQLSYQVHHCGVGAIPAWQWLSGGDAGKDVNAIIRECSTEVKALAGLDSVLPELNQPGAGLTVVGGKTGTAGADGAGANGVSEMAGTAGFKVPRQSHRYSGRTAMIANLNVHEPKQPEDGNSVLSFSMEGIPSTKDASVLGAAWSPAWNSNQSISKFQDEINGELKQGHGGTRLIERRNTGSYLPPASANPEGGEGNAGQFALTRSLQIFGSDALSSRVTAIQQRMTASYLSLSPSDAESLGIATGDAVSLNGSGAVAIACIRSKIKPGVVALYADATIDVYALPAVVSLQKVQQQASQSPQMQQTQQTQQAQQAQAQQERSRSLAGLIISDRVDQTNSAGEAQ